MVRVQGLYRQIANDEITDVPLSTQNTSEKSPHGKCADNPKSNERFGGTKQNYDSYKWLSIVYGPIVSVHYTAVVFSAIFWSWSHSLLEKIRWQQLELQECHHLVLKLIWTLLGLSRQILISSSANTFSNILLLLQSLKVNNLNCYVYFYMHVCVLYRVHAVLVGFRKGITSPGTGVTSSCMMQVLGTESRHLEGQSML